MKVRNKILINHENLPKKGFFGCLSWWQDRVVFNCHR